MAYQINVRKHSLAETTPPKIEFHHYAILTDHIRYLFTRIACVGIRIVFWLAAGVMSQGKDGMITKATPGVPYASA